ncbi:MAG: hypothetical protein WAU36_15320 [Cyclobacteriaceae bacterium]
MPVLKIDERKPVSDFQKEFATLFPFLKIEFFKTQVIPSDHQDHKAGTLLAPNFPLSKDTVSVDLSPSKTVAQLKNMLFEKTGISCLVYRKSGSMWIEISLTEDWTLERQNHEAELMNIH